MSTTNHLGGTLLLRQDITVCQEQVNEVRQAAFLDRASTAAKAIVEGFERNYTQEAMDKLRAQRDHWMREANGTSN